MVDTELNLVEGLLASLGAQGGRPGPASTLLGVAGGAMPATDAGDAERWAAPTGRVGARDDAEQHE